MSMKVKAPPGRRAARSASFRMESVQGTFPDDRHTESATRPRRTCLLIVSDAGLEIALRSAVELLSNVACETLSLNRLASLTRAEDPGLGDLVPGPDSFLIVDSRTEGLPSLQPLILRLEGRVVCVSSTRIKRRRLGGGSFRLDPEAPLLEVVESLRSWIDPSGTRIPSDGAGGKWVGNLGVRETQILELLAAGKRYVDIAEALGISLDTVRSHLRRIYPKLGVQSRTAAVSAYLRRRRRRQGNSKEQP